MPALTADALGEALAPLISAPARAALFLDIDGTLAPIVDRSDAARVPEETARLLAVLARRYRCVACVSGRSAAEARRLVGVGSITYAGTHGTELIEPGSAEPHLAPAVERWSGPIRHFARAHADTSLRLLRIRVEDKGPIVAYHWRAVPDEEAAHRRLRALAREAREEGLHVHWGRKVLEVRPPVPIDKGQAVRHLVGHCGTRTALFAGDDATDLDGFSALDELKAEGALDVAVKVGLRSSEGPADIVRRADLVVDGPAGFRAVLATLAA